MANLMLRDVVKSYSKVKVLHEVNLDINDGEFIVFVGPSGCGKSTLLRLIAGLEDITSGEFMIDGQRVNDVPPAQRGVAMVFQSYALYPHMSVRENMAFGLKIAKESDQTITEKVEQVAELLQLSNLLERLPKHLSGGQRQRVAIGRAIVRNPQIFLFDEPLSNLDAALRVQMRIEIAKLHDDLAVTMIYVTHDQVEAMTLANRIVVLNRGRVEQVGAPLELYHSPRNIFVAGFIGSPTMNFIDGLVQQSSGNGQYAIKLDNGLTIDVKPNNAEGSGLFGVDDKAVVGIRPEHLRPGDEGDAAFRGKVELVEQLGEAQLLYVNIGRENPLVSKCPGSHNIKKGENISLAADNDCFHLFDGDGLAI